MKKKILITGASGLLGRSLVDLLSAENTVYAVSRSNEENFGVSVNHVFCDLSWPVERWNLPLGVDVVIHLAQSNMFRDFPKGAPDMFDINVRATAALLEYTRKAGAQRFVYASSGGLYGAGASAFDENAEINDHGRLGFYLGTKLCGEVLVRNYISLFDVSILRFFFVYGKIQKRSMLLPRLADNVIAGRSIQLDGHDGICINPIHVSDAARAVAATLLQTGSCTYNIAGREVVSLREIGELIGRVSKIEPAFQVNDIPARHLIANITAMETDLVSPMVGLEQGILELISP